MVPPFSSFEGLERGWQNSPLKTASHVCAAAIQNGTNGEINDISANHGNLRKPPEQREEGTKTDTK